MHLLNGMLRVYANSGRIEPALRFYDVEYNKNGVVSIYPAFHFNETHHSMTFS